MLVLAAASSMSACIIPVAPEFQDPPETQTGLPYFFNPNPPFGTLKTLPATPGSQLEFTVSVGDSSPGVTLWYRWALDYPAFTSSTFAPPQEPLPPSGVDIILNCEINVDPSLPQHQLFLMVADQPFIVTTPPTLDTVADPIPGHVIENSWQVDMSCMAMGGTP